MSLEEIDQRRRHLWMVAGFFLVAVSLVVFFALTDTGLSEAMPDIAALRWGFLALTSAFLLYALDQERTLRKMTVTLMERDALTASLRSRIADLTTLTRVGRLMNSVLTLDEVVSTVLDAAFELTRARNGALLVREGDELRVRGSIGPEAEPVGTTVALGAGIAGHVAAFAEPVLLDGSLDLAREMPDAADRDGGSVIVVPLLAHGEVQGVLALDRAPDEAPFSGLDLRSLVLFAEQAATAVTNARRYEEERSTAARLADVIELRSEVVATLVHDLKNPLAAILGYMNVLRRRWSAMQDQERENALVTVEAQAVRLIDMVEAVLRSASVEAHQDLRREPVDLGELLTGLTEETRAAVEGREGVPRHVEVRVPDATVIEADPEALRHVFMNLLENAVKYSPAGSPITVAIVHSGDMVRVDIRDEGIGIAEEHLPHVFERFRQVSGSGRSGVGLGLYIVRTLITAHGGRVWVDSAEGSGSTFHVALPVHAPTDEGQVGPKGALVG
jgi:signal transduction histidine kinase